MEVFSSYKIFKQNNWLTDIKCTLNSDLCGPIKHDGALHIKFSTPPVVHKEFLLVQDRLGLSLTQAQTLEPKPKDLGWQKPEGTKPTPTRLGLS